MAFTEAHDNWQIINRQIDIYLCEYLRIDTRTLYELHCCFACPNRDQYRIEYIVRIE